MQETSTSNSSQFPTQHREEKNEINASIRIVPMTEIDVELKKITGKSIDNVVSGGAEVYVRKGTYSHLYEEQAVGKSSAKRMAAWLGGMLLVGSAAVSHLYAQQSSGQAEYTGVTVEDKMRLHDQLEARKQERAGKKFMQHIDDLITKGVVYQHVERISFASSETDNKALGVNATSSSVNDYAPILEHVQQQLLQARFDTGLEGKAQLTQIISFYLEHYKAFETASQYTGISPAALLAAAVNTNGIPQGPEFFYKGLQGKVAMTYANEEGKTYALSSLYDNVSDS